MIRVLFVTFRAATTLLAVSFLMFLLLFIGPNPLEQFRSNPEYTPADIERITHEFGWDRPWYVQYGDWLGDFVKGDWGESLRTKRPAKEMIVERLPLTLLLAGIAEMIALSIAI